MPVDIGKTILMPIVFYQIEADLQVLCRRVMVNSAVDFCDRIGHIMLTVMDGMAEYT
jgi:hypothetical protein